VVGAAALLLLEEVVSAWTIHWQFWVGWVLLGIVLFAPRGLVGLLSRWRGGGRR
jgi:branched-chain amino acid transport system permease protein